jgi:hypothetical protein
LVAVEVVEMMRVVVVVQAAVVKVVDQPLLVG